MQLSTRLTDLLGIKHPILGAPMAHVAGGKLAAAVTEAGGLGMIGGGYGDADWIEAEWRQAGNTPVGIGFITWSMAKDPGLLTAALAHRPRCVMLSFGDAAPFAAAIKDARAILICQVQTVADAKAAAALGADVIVAQGSEAGGHGAARATLPLVPEVVDAVHPVPVVAAGGIADGRGLAAALALGAAGVLIGTRLWATEEAIGHKGAKARIVAATGDNTLRGGVVDAVRGIDWPAPYTCRTLSNEFSEHWKDRSADLWAEGTEARKAYFEAVSRGDFDAALIIAGESAGLIGTVEPAGAVIEAMVSKAVDTLLGTVEGSIRMSGS